jgi:hypothetical protein
VVNEDDGEDYANIKMTITNSMFEGEAPTQRMRKEDRGAATSRSFFVPLFTQVLRRRILGTSP